LAGLRSTEPLSRRRAAFALARGGDASALAALDSAYAMEKDKATRAALAEARARLRERLAPKKTSAPASKR
jgi:histidinol-phosphate/aromatic aminotransferase/cobyric acid decarboxylase-like protein